MFLRFFPDHKWFCDAVFIQHKSNAAAHLRGVVSLVGKTHLAIAVGLRACQARKRVLFTSATNLLDGLLAAEVSRRLGKFIEMLGGLHLLVVDELDYAPMDAHRANLLFQLVSHLYTRVSTVVNGYVPSFGCSSAAGAFAFCSATAKTALATASPTKRVKPAA